MKPSKRPEQIDLLPYLGKSIFLATAVAALAGSASAFFLFALDWATATRIAHRWLIWLLPVAGFVVGWLYLHFGQNVEAGNNLLIDEIHDPKKVILMTLYLTQNLDPAQLVLAKTSGIVHGVKLYPMGVTTLSRIKA